MLCGEQLLERIAPQDVAIDACPQQNWELLLSLCQAGADLHPPTVQMLQRAVQRHGGTLLLSAHLSAWVEFLSTYGVTPDVILKVLCECPEVLTTDLFSVGEVFLFFKGFGYTDTDIRARLCCYYPGLLRKSVRLELLPVVDFLERSGARGRNLQLLVWEFPRIFMGSHRLHVRKFARLGVYGLREPPGSGPGSASSTVLESWGR